MTTIPFPTDQMPDEQALLTLCEYLPDRFRLDGPLEGTIDSGQVQASFTYRNLEGDWGPGWNFAGISLDSNHSEMQEYETEGVALDMVWRYCHDEQVRLILSHAPQRPTFQQCAVTLDRGDGVLHVGTGYSPSVAALRALARALIAWGKTVNA